MPVLDRILCQVQLRLISQTPLQLTDTVPSALPSLLPHHSDPLVSELEQAQSQRALAQLGTRNAEIQPIHAGIVTHHGLPTVHLPSFEAPVVETRGEEEEPSVSRSSGPMDAEPLEHHSDIVTETVISSTMDAPMDDPPCAASCCSPARSSIKAAGPRQERMNKRRHGRGKKAKRDMGKRAEYFERCVDESKGSPSSVFDGGDWSDEAATATGMEDRALAKQRLASRIKDHASRKQLKHAKIYKAKLRQMCREIARNPSGRLDQARSEHLADGGEHMENKHRRAERSSSHQSMSAPAPMPMPEDSRRAKRCKQKKRTAKPNRPPFVTQTVRRRPQSKRGPSYVR